MNSKITNLEETAPQADEVWVFYFIGVKPSTSNYKVIARLRKAMDFDKDHIEYTSILSGESYQVAGGILAGRLGIIGCQKIDRLDNAPHGSRGHDMLSEFLKYEELNKVRSDISDLLDKDGVINMDLSGGNVEVEVDSMIAWLNSLKSSGVNKIDFWAYSSDVGNIDLYIDPKNSV